MTKPKLIVILGIFLISTTCFGGAAVGFLVLEAYGVVNNFPITHIIQEAWAKQPWVIFLVSHWIMQPLSFLMGHFLAQNDDVYNRWRGSK